jgi:DNA polymerase-3 subunit epsilon
VAEVDLDADWRELPIAMLDVETTGTDSATDRIVEVGIVCCVGGEIVARQNWLINPGRPIPKEASQVHKIKDEDVQDAPPFAAVAPAIVEFFKGYIPAAYNAPFDRAFLWREMDRLELPEPVDAPALRKDVEWIDPLIWARELQQGERSRALGDVVARLGIVLESAHRATHDAEAALGVLLAFGRDVRVPRSYAAFVQEQRRLSMSQADARRNKWRG